MTPPAVRCEARFALLDPATAALDVAEACGALRVADLPRDPLGASSAGAGELIRAALASGATTVIVGVGGTATSDGGVGLRDTLGQIPPDVRAGGRTGRDKSAAWPGGRRGRVRSRRRARRRSRWPSWSGGWRASNCRRPALPGAGAGGGIGGMLMAMGAESASGADLVMDHAGFDAVLATVDSVYHRRGPDRHVDARRQGCRPRRPAVPGGRSGVRRGWRRRRCRRPPTRCANWAVTAWSRAISNAPVTSWVTRHA